MSLAFESPTHRGNGANEAYFTPLNMPATNQQTAATEDSSTANTPYYTAPINPSLHQDFLNAIQARHSSQTFNNTTVSTPPIQSPTTPGGGFNLSMGSSIANRRQQMPLLNTSSSPFNTNALPTGMSNICSSLKPMESSQLLQLLKSQFSLLVLDVRSFVQFSTSRIQQAINVSIPNTILKRPTFTLDNVYEAIVLDNAREKLKSWSDTEFIIFYDQQSQLLQENTPSNYLAIKLVKAGYKGQLAWLKGGFESFAMNYKDQCESNISNATVANTSAFQLQQQQQMLLRQMGPPTISNDSPASTTNSSLSSRRPRLRLDNLPSMTSSNTGNPMLQGAPNGQTGVLGPFTAPMPQFENQAFNPFFSNIRQNMELSHGPIRERFPIRLPSSSKNDKVDQQQKPRCVAGGRINNDDASFVAPDWLQSTIKENGAQILAETYEKLERTEQRRLQNIMHFHSKHTDNPAEFPFSIVAGIEMGALNRYTNIWPFEYTRVKIRDPKVSDYINASYVQYIDSDDTVSDARPETIDTNTVKEMKAACSRTPPSPQTITTDEHSTQTNPYRRYISTQGPLPATFNDFWQVVWEQNSRVLVMLTKEEEMNKIKCHRYWPTTVNTPTHYGGMTVTMTSETIVPVQKHNPHDAVNEDDVVIVRQLDLINTKTNTTRKVTHLQYTGWMDFGVPDNPLGTLQIIQMADQAQQAFSKSGPMTVHCSAGCGRSGAFCAIDTVLYRISRAAQDEVVATKDILLETISRFREQRLSMVQTLRQFVFCYEAIWWWFLGYGSVDKKVNAAINVADDSSMDTSL